jgi:hypothetical protein
MKNFNMSDEVHLRPMAGLPRAAHAEDCISRVRYASLGCTLDVPTVTENQLPCEGMKEP